MRELNEIKNWMSLLDGILSLWTMVDWQWLCEFKRMLFNDKEDGWWILEWTEWICPNDEEEIQREYCESESVSIDSVFEEDYQR